MIKIKDHHILNNTIQIICMGGKMSQKFPVNDFEWIEDTSQINEDLIKNYIEESGEEYFLEVDVQYLEKLHELHSDFPFLSERMKVESPKACY